MPGPFPGMDPYLEHPTLWTGVQQGEIGAMRSALNQALPAGYVADIGERVYVVRSERSIYPDVAVKRLPSASPEPGRMQGAAGAGCDPPWVLPVEVSQVREVFLEILSTYDTSRVVTVIEFLSPTNKAPGSEGRQLYLTKQNELLTSQTHLIEIDLLRQGEHTVAAPRERLLELGTWDYLVTLHPHETPEHYDVWPILMRQRLPRIRVPLTSGDPAVVLDLQETFDRCYDEGAYARRIDYRRDPPVPLSPEDAEWAAALLRERGLRD
jgi:Protein of unknown function (DUF4058)